MLYMKVAHAGMTCYPRKSPDMQRRSTCSESVCGCSCSQARYWVRRPPIPPCVPEHPCPVFSLCPRHVTVRRRPADAPASCDCTSNARGSRSRVWNPIGGAHADEPLSSVSPLCGAQAPPPRATPEARGSSWWADDDKWLPRDPMGCPPVPRTAALKGISVWLLLGRLVQVPLWITRYVPDSALRILLLGEHIAARPGSSRGGDS